jgi:hypothetical protein
VREKVKGEGQMSKAAVSRLKWHKEGHSTVKHRVPADNSSFMAGWI